MPITAICLLQLRSAPQLPTQGPVRVEALQDGLLLHTPLDFGDDPEELASAVRSLLGEPLASEHRDARGVFLIPSAAAPKARSYAEVIAEVGEGGVWSPWTEPQPTAAGPQDLSGMLSGMLGGMPGFAAAAASLRDNPDALRQAGAALPGLLDQPGALADLVQTSSSQLPELAGMLRGMGIDLASPEIQELTRGLQQELTRDPSRLLQLAEQLFAGQAGDTGQDDEDDEDDDKAQH
jgi:hypothetical protein